MKRTMLLLSISVLAILVSGWINLAEAQKAGKVYRIGYVRGCGYLRRTDPPLAHHLAFWQRLCELGYIEGQNLVIESRSGEGKRERLPDLAAELVRLKIDVIVTSPAPPATRAA